MLRLADKIFTVTRAITLVYLNLKKAIKVAGSYNGSSSAHHSW